MRATEAPLQHHQVSILHNLVLWLYGLLIDHHGSGNFVPLHDADD
ncbi:hypothetical protein [Streptomyces sp. NPDC018584]